MLFEIEIFKLPPVDLTLISNEIKVSPISSQLISVSYTQPDLSLVFASQISDEDTIILNSIVGKHTAGIVESAQSVLNKYIIDSKPLHTVSKWMKVAGSTTDDTTNMLVPDSGLIMGTYFVTLSGSEPDVYATLAFDWGGAKEKIIASTRGAKDWILNPKLEENQIIGDGVSTFGIILVNESVTQSPVVGGHFETTEIK